MMKKSLILILSVALLTACAPAATVTEPPAVDVVTATLPAPTVESVTQAATALPIATSRGPNLEATDPTTVSLASGGLQFVEFFRFT